MRAFLERRDHPTKRAVEHLARQCLENARSEGEIDAEIDVGAALAVGDELPVVLQIFEGAFDIIDRHVFGLPLLDPRCEGFLQRPEADGEKNGRASGREGGWRYGYIVVG